MNCSVFKPGNSVLKTADVIHDVNGRNFKVNKIIKGENGAMTLWLDELFQSIPMRLIPRSGIYT